MRICVASHIKNKTRHTKRAAASSIHRINRRLCFKIQYLEKWLVLQKDKIFISIHMQRQFCTLHYNSRLA